MDIKEYRRIKQKERLRKAERITPGQRIEEAVELSEITMEINRAFKKKLNERTYKKGRIIS